MRVLAVVLFALWATACASGPGPGDRAPGGSCQWQVCILARYTEGGVAYLARNDGPVVATVSLSFTRLRNLRLQDPVPIETTLESGEIRTLTRLPRVDRAAPVAAHPTVRIDLGSDSTRPDPDVRYAFPFGGSERRQLVGGYGSPTHLAQNFYALDFAVPEGTPVLAARAGVVVEVQDGYEEGGLVEDLMEKANLVAVAHADGTLASYGHLRRGVRVQVGDSVARGTRLGSSGNTGFSGHPHLHFHVGKRLAGGGWTHTIPVEFVDAAGRPIRLTEGGWYDPAAEFLPTAGDPVGSAPGLPGA